jgi:hypothetical protein
LRCSFVKNGIWCSAACKNCKGVSCLNIHSIEDDYVNEYIDWNYKLDFVPYLTLCRHLKMAAECSFLIGGELGQVGL